MADGKTLEFEIMTPQKRVFKGVVESLVAEATDGSFGVLLDHAPMLSAIKFGIVRLKETGGGAEKVFVTSDGFFEVNDNRASLLVDTAETKEEIDVARAKAAFERAEQRLNNPAESIDIERARAALMRALTRLQATGSK